MIRFVTRLGIAILLGISVALAAKTPEPGRATPQARFRDYSRYRSPGAHHKLIVQSYERRFRDELISRGARVLEDYGSFALLDAPDEAVAFGLAQQSEESALRDDMNLILLRARTFDTTTEPSESADQHTALSSSNGAGQQLALVQMIGPIRPGWLSWLRARAAIVSYIPNNAYLVRLDPSRAIDINPNSAGGPRFVQWVGPYQPAYKLAPELLTNSEPEVSVTVQILNTSDEQEDLRRILLLSKSQISRPEKVLKYVNLTLRVDRGNLPELASIADVIWIEPVGRTNMLDERQDQIVAGNFLAGQFLSHDYLAWLQSKGLSSTPDFLVDIADSGIDTGDINPPVLHKVFLDQSGQSRIAYARMAPGSPDGPVNDTTGHGTINASIIAGYDQVTSFPDGDDQGLRNGLGIDPVVRLGVTKVFNPDFINPNYATMVNAMYADGARVSSNSWGAQANSYTIASQTYDALTRDADPGAPGNQQMTFVFAAGNSGSGGNINSPGTAKNVITVGASQSYRPDGIDGCGIAASGANDPDSIIGFSSGGPVQDGRIKPDLVAPGTHIEGALSQDPANTGRDICGPKFWPPGQTLYTWSSGTSQAAPAVSGAAALTLQYFKQSTGSLPSPAMVKAFLLNSTDFISGQGGGFNLPGANQGWGRLDIGRAFDGVPRTIVDQTRLLTSTGQTFTLHARVVDPSKEVRVTLAWTDAPGSPEASAVVNDLDLQVNQGGQTYLGNHFLGQTSLPGGSPDKLNNVEAVWLGPGHTGEIVITVIAANLAGDGVPGNSNPTDQDFALVAYNAVADDGSVDAPPTVSLTYPVGGEHIAAGSVANIQWKASDDNGIQSQEVELSTDGGITFQMLAQLDGNARSFEWEVPQLSTSQARVEIQAFDGANLPVASASLSDFSIDIGPPDTTPPQVQLIFPSAGSLIGGGTSTEIQWSESDNLGVVKRVIEFSTDKGQTYQTVATVMGPSSGDSEQNYQWHVPADLSAKKGRLRITVYDDAGNSAQSVSTGKIKVWALPTIVIANYKTLDSGRGELTITGSNFRPGQTVLYVNDVALSRLKYQSPSASGDGTFNKMISDDKNLDASIPVGVAVTITAQVALTGQVSRPFAFVRTK